MVASSQCASSGATRRSTSRVMVGRRGSVSRRPDGVGMGAGKIDYLCLSVSLSLCLSRSLTAQRLEDGLPLLLRPLLPQRGVVLGQHLLLCCCLRRKETRGVGTSSLQVGGRPDGTHQHQHTTRTIDEASSPSKSSGSSLSPARVGPAPAAAAARFRASMAARVCVWSLTRLVRVRVLPLLLSSRRRSEEEATIGRRAHAPVFLWSV